MTDTTELSARLRELASDLEATFGGLKMIEADAMRKAADTIDRLTAENATLRSLFPEICRALGNGAQCVPDVSLDFLKHVPAEVAAVVATLRRDLGEAQRDLVAAWNAFGPPSKRGGPLPFDADDLVHLPLSAAGDLAEQITFLEDSLAASESARLAAEAKLAEMGRDKVRLDLLQNESWDARCFSIPICGGDDADIGWRIIGHWQAKPHEREVGVAYHDDIRAAIDDAAARLTKDQQS